MVKKYFLGLLLSLSLCNSAHTFKSEDLLAPVYDAGAKTAEWVAEHKLLVASSAIAAYSTYQSYNLFSHLSKLVFVPTVTQEEIVWTTTPENKEVTTVFYQGLKNSLTQLTNYTGSRGFIAPTGEHIVSALGIDIAYNPLTNNEIEEVILKGDSRLQKYALRDHFFHMLSSVVNNSKRITYTQPETSTGMTMKSHSLVFDKVCIGQENDMINFDKKFTAQQQQKPSVLFGVSRGSATVFNSVADRDYDLSNVKMIILEGCFDSVINIIDKRWGKLYQLMPTSVFKYLAKKSVPGLNVDGPFPIQHADKFANKAQNVPVVFITSKIDKVVPHECTVALANAVKEAGHKEVYLLKLEKSAHPYYHIDHADDRAKYLHFMHAVYKKHGLPYSEAQAALGEHLLEEALL